jgi:L-iditol 2-dehydrogenase
MKAMMLTGIRQMEMMDIPTPLLVNSDDVKIKMSVVGVCGSDVHYYKNGKIGSQLVGYPFPVGHEGAGIVVETGYKVKRVKPGDAVAIEPAMPCHKCDQCLAGRQHTCRKLRFLGCPGQAAGCLTEYIVMPEESCFPLGNILKPDHGAISEPLAIGVYAVKRSDSPENPATGILGFGPIGMSVMLAAKAMGTGNIYITDKIDERLEIARKENAILACNPDRENVVNKLKEKEPLGFDVIFECCGKQEAVDQAVELLKPGGRLMVVGIPEFDKWTLNVDKTRHKEINILFVRRQVNCVQASLDMMEAGTVNIQNMITHRFPFARTKEAFDILEGYKDGAMKVMIDF